MVDKKILCPVCKGTGNDVAEMRKHEEKTGITERIACHYCGGVGNIKLLSLAVAQELLGNAVICLEPDEVIESKLNSGKEPELWGFNIITGISGRGDKKFFDIRLIDRGGYNQLVLYDEPNVPKMPAEMRVVGHVIIEVIKGQVIARKANGINGPILELKPSSVSKDELIKNGIKPIAYIETNPQRIDGTVAVYMVELKKQPQLKPNEVIIAPAEFAKKSTDSRSLAAIAVSGLL